MANPYNASVSKRFRLNPAVEEPATRDAVGRWRWRCDARNPILSPCVKMLVPEEDTNPVSQKWYETEASCLSACPRLPSALVAHGIGPFVMSGPVGGRGDRPAQAWATVSRSSRQVATGLARTRQRDVTVLNQMRAATFRADESAETIADRVAAWIRAYPTTINKERFCTEMLDILRALLGHATPTIATLRDLWTPIFAASRGAGFFPPVSPVDVAARALASAGRQDAKAEKQVLDWFVRQPFVSDVDTTASDFLLSGSARGCTNTPPQVRVLEQAVEYPTLGPALLQAWSSDVLLAAVARAFAAGKLLPDTLGYVASSLRGATNDLQRLGALSQALQSIPAGRKPAYPIMRQLVLGLFPSAQLVARNRSGILDALNEIAGRVAAREIVVELLRFLPTAPPAFIAVAVGEGDGESAPSVQLSDAVARYIASRYSLSIPGPRLLVRDYNGEGLCIGGGMLPVVSGLRYVYLLTDQTRIIIALALVGAEDDARVLGKLIAHKARVSPEEFGAALPALPVSVEVVLAGPNCAVIKVDLPAVPRTPPAFVGQPLPE